MHFKNNIILLTFALFIFLSESVQSTLVQKESAWKYLDSGKALSSSWIQTDFNDSDWQRNKGMFGNSDDAATKLKPVTTTYFRKKFKIDSTENIHGIYLDILLNAGVVVYLNGKEIKRLNMPDGEIVFSTMPESIEKRSERKKYQNYFIKDGYNLKKGINIIAAEVHQNRSADKNTWFDLQFSVLKLNDPPDGIKKLDSLAVYSFSIMSDNKGYGLENMHMFKCDHWIREAGDRFIIGLGDHVKDNRPNPFLPLIKTDSLWHNHFYPNVADGENEYWGEDQADWGSGAPILDYVDLANRSHVIIRSNKCEYYALEEHEGIKVHIIQLHYSDSPKDPAIAFNESSRQYLMDVLDRIKKTDNDIIVVLAHTGPWVEQLNESRKKKLLSKADLILGATTHWYKRYIFSRGNPDSGALAFNTGAVGNSGDSGFLHIHVLKNPTRIIVQYQQTKNSSRILQKEEYAYLKFINGKITGVNWDQVLKRKSALNPSKPKKMKLLIQ